MAVNIAHNFEPEYITVRGKAEKLKELTEEAKRSEAVVLAADPDREGEAIAYQIGKYLKEKVKDAPIQRVTFNEITKPAVQDAMLHPRDIDMNLVEAQKARRVIDRLVGYTLSPLLWKKVKSGLSAGRVQSVALKLICEREKRSSPLFLKNIGPLKRSCARISICYMRNYRFLRGQSLRLRVKQRLCKS